MEDPDQEYERLIKPIEDRMISSVWRITRNPDDADDAFQEALMTIWKKLRNIQRHPNPHALILRICVNSAYDVIRKKLRYRKQEELEAISSDMIDSKPTAEETILNNETQAEIFQAITRLSRNQATAALMRFVQELSYGDIAEALGCREATARKHVARARSRLSTLLAHLLPQSGKEAQQ